MQNSVASVNTNRGSSGTQEHVKESVSSAAGAVPQLSLSPVNHFSASPPLPPPNTIVSAGAPTERPAVSPKSHPPQRLRYSPQRAPLPFTSGTLSANNSMPRSVAGGSTAMLPNVQIPTSSLHSVHLVPQPSLGCGIAGDRTTMGRQKQNPGGASPLQQQRVSAPPRIAGDSLASSNGGGLNFTIGKGGTAALRRGSAPVSIGTAASQVASHDREEVPMSQMRAVRSASIKTSASPPRAEGSRRVSGMGSTVHTEGALLPAMASKKRGSAPSVDITKIGGQDGASHPPYTVTRANGSGTPGQQEAAGQRSRRGTGMLGQLYRAADAKGFASAARRSDPNPLHFASGEGTSTGTTQPTQGNLAVRGSVATENAFGNQMEDSFSDETSSSGWTSSSGSALRLPEVVDVNSVAETASVYTNGGASKQEWLLVPSLFYLFANIIKWNELQIERRGIETSRMENLQRHGENSMSLLSDWSESKEAEVRYLEGHITYAVFEIRGTLLNPLYVRWSKPQMRSLVSQVTSTWSKEGPYSPEFEQVSTRLFDAISAEESSTVKNTVIFDIKQSLGSMHNRRTMMIVNTVLFVVALVCVILIGVLGRTHLAALIVLSVVLGLIIIAVYLMNLLILDHNAYNDAAAAFFREEAITSAREKMEDDDGEGPENENKRHDTRNARNRDSSWSDSSFLESAVEGLNHDGRGKPPIGARRRSGTQPNGPAGNGAQKSQDEGFLSMVSRSLQMNDPAHRERLERDRDNAILMSGYTYEQHQRNITLHQSQILQEKFGPELGSFSPMRQTGSSTGTGPKGAIQKASLTGQQRALMNSIADRINITALIYCKTDSVLHTISNSLWERNFLVFSCTDLDVLDATFQQGSERFKVFLVHAPDAPQGSAAFTTVLKWLQEDRRPVFFFSSNVASFSSLVPVAAQLETPLSSTDMDALLYSGVGVEAEVTAGSDPTAHNPYAGKTFQVPAYTLGRRLGGGATGNVFEAEIENTGAKCAVKRMYLKGDGDFDDSDDGGGQDADGGDGGIGAQLREIAQEVEIMSSLSHPNIVQYMFSERDDNCISIFMELCTGGSLNTLIHSGELVDPETIKRVLTDIISAVAYLHNRRIVHRDLKPDNVLFRDGRAKLTDFGTAVHKRGDLQHIKGTFAYMAPEILVGDPYGRACDVWSIGCIAAEVLSVDLPQRALGLPEMCDYYRAMDSTSALPIQCEVPTVKAFLLACLQRGPNARETATQLLSHPMLRAEDSSVYRWMKLVIEQRRQQQLAHRSVTGYHPGMEFDLDSNRADESLESLQSSKVLGDGRS